MESFRVHIGAHVDKDRKISIWETSIREIYYARASLRISMIKNWMKISYGHTS